MVPPVFAILCRGFKDIHQIKSRGNIPDAKPFPSKATKTHAVSPSALQSKSLSDNKNIQKPKDPKPKVRRAQILPLHPPDQRRRSPLRPWTLPTAALCSSSRQLFLQLQVLSQQQQHHSFSYPGCTAAPLR